MQLQKLLSHELTLIILGYDQRVSNVDCVYQDCRNKRFMFTIKEVWDRVGSPENQFLTSTIADGGLLPL